MSTQRNAQVKPRLRVRNRCPYFRIHLSLSACKAFACEDVQLLESRRIALIPAFVSARNNRFFIIAYPVSMFQNHKKRNPVHLFFTGTMHPRSYSLLTSRSVTFTDIKKGHFDKEMLRPPRRGLCQSRS